MTGPVVTVLFLVLIMVSLFGLAYFIKNNAWEKLITSSLMKGFFTEFDQDQIGNRLEFDIMRDFGYTNRGTVLDETVDTEDEDDDELDSDPEEVEKKVEELEDGKQTELMKV